MLIINKLMVFFLVFSVLIVIREFFSFLFEMIKPNGRYNPSTKRKVIVASAISYIFTIIFTGFGI